MVQERRVGVWEFWEYSQGVWVNLLGVLVHFFSSIEADTYRVKIKPGKNSLPPTPSCNWDKTNILKK